MTEPPPVNLDPEAVRALKCRHGCDEAIVVVFHFPLGCACLDDQVQPLCHRHMAKATSNIVHGPMIRRLWFGEWPDSPPAE